MSEVGNQMSDLFGLLTSDHRHLNMAVCFCGTFLRVASTGYYPAPCPMELGLSSCSMHAIIWLTQSIDNYCLYWIIILTYFCVACQKYLIGIALNYKLRSCIMLFYYTMPATSVLGFACNRF